MRRAALALAFVVALASGSVTAALARDDGARIIARVRCAHPAEDALAHLRMLRYTARDDGTIVAVYRCERSGY